jgi:hypothetical protein
MYTTRIIAAVVSLSFCFPAAAIAGSPGGSQPRNSSGGTGNVGTPNAGASARSRAAARQGQTAVQGDNRLFLQRNVAAPAVSPGNQWMGPIPQGECVPVKVEGGVSAAPGAGDGGVNAVLNAKASWQPGARDFCEWQTKQAGEHRIQVAREEGKAQIRIQKLKGMQKVRIETIKACLQQRLSQGKPVYPGVCQGRQAPPQRQPQPQQPQPPQQPQKKGPSSY